MCSRRPSGTRCASATCICRLQPYASRLQPYARRHALLFCGRWLHAGVRVARGVRYVLTGFCEATLPPLTQLALERVVALEQVHMVYVSEWVGG